MSTSIFFAKFRFWERGGLFWCFGLLLSQVQVGINWHAHYSCERATYTGFAWIGVEEIVVSEKDYTGFKLPEYDVADSRGSPVDFVKLKD